MFRFSILFSFTFYFLFLARLFKIARSNFKVTLMVNFYLYPDWGYHASFPIILLMAKSPRTIKFRFKRICSQFVQNSTEENQRLAWMMFKSTLFSR